MTLENMGDSCGLARSFLMGVSDVAGTLTADGWLSIRDSLASLRRGLGDNRRGQLIVRSLGRLGRFIFPSFPATQIETYPSSCQPKH